MSKVNAPGEAVAPDYAQHLRELSQRMMKNMNRLYDSEAESVDELEAKAWELFVTKRLTPAQSFERARDWMTERDRHR